MNKKMIIELLESHSMKAKVFGAVTTLIPDTEFSELADEILLLIEPKKKVSVKA